MADILDTLRTWLGVEAGPEEAGEAPQQPGKPAKPLIIDKQKIVEIVKELEHRHSSGITIADIVTEAKKVGIEEEQTRALVNELVHDGFLFRPRWMSDMVRLHGVHDYCPWSEDFPT